ncbi:hypothetical protein LCGC14_0527430 [marine sediment metagenome]|uniref:Uncharacterized protein n=1 Tax=marine sediment metagenome TaxID=412755 RepID=A0A0F9SF13_9ZZZZ
MTDTHTLKMIEHKIDLVEAEGFGEIRVKIRNGAVYQVIKSDSTYVEKERLDKKGG